MDLKDMQSKIREHGEKFKAKSKELEHHLPNNVSFPYFKAVEELGEVADLLVRKHGFQRKGKEISDEEFKKKLGEELSDVMTCLTHLANFSGIDLDEAIKNKLKEMDDRWDNKEY